VQKRKGAEKVLRKYLMLAIVMVFIMILPMIMYPVSAIVPTSPTGAGGAVQNPNTLVEDTLYGGGPATLDPAAEYDTAFFCGAHALNGLENVQVW
jgi:hypothetical protein